MQYQYENFSGEYDFRCRRHDEFMVDLHLHEYSELLYVVRGEATVTVNNRQCFLREKELMFIPPNIGHAYLCRDCEVICAVFSNDFIPAFFRQLGRRRVRPQAMDFSELAAFIERLPDLQTANTVTVCGYLNIICGKIYESAQLQSATGAEGSLYPKILSYLQENHTADLTLQAVAREFGYHEKYLSKVLHETAGMNFRRLLCLYRVNHARELLSRTEYSKTVSEIAMEVGFDALTTFNRVFKAMVGMTPSQYRRRLEAQRTISDSYGTTSI